MQPIKIREGSTAKKDTQARCVTILTQNKFSGVENWVIDVDYDTDSG